MLNNDNDNLFLLMIYDVLALSKQIIVVIRRNKYQYLQVGIVTYSTMPKLN
jgi:hypothetical protein